MSVCEKRPAEDEPEEQPPAKRACCEEMEEAVSFTGCDEEPDSMIHYYVLKSQVPDPKMWEILSTKEDLSGRSIVIKEEWPGELSPLREFLEQFIHDNLPIENTPASWAAKKSCIIGKRFHTVATHLFMLYN